MEDVKTWATQCTLLLPLSKEKRKKEKQNHWCYEKMKMVRSLDYDIECNKREVYQETRWRVDKELDTYRTFIRHLAKEAILH